MPEIDILLDILPFRPYRSSSVAQLHGRFGGTLKSGEAAKSLVDWIHRREPGDQKSDGDTDKDHQNPLQQPGQNIFLEISQTINLA